MAAVTVHSDYLESKKMKSVTASTFSSSTFYEVMGLDAMILVFWMLSFKPAFSLSSSTLIKRLFSSSLLSASGIISIYKVVDISPGNLDSSLWFIQPNILHDVLCIEVKYAGWQYTTLLYSFPNFEPAGCYM